jgi:hypothetical protein
MKKYNMKDLPVFFIEHAEKLSGQSADEAGLGFVTAVAFLVEKHYGGFATNKGEQEVSAYKRYRMERTAEQVAGLFEQDIDPDDVEGK